MNRNALLFAMTMGAASYGAPLPELTPAAGAVERQLTHAAHGHVLANVNVWSPDSRWIVYDVRSADNVFDGERIEQVNAETGEVQVVYRASQGARCGVASFHPTEPIVAFILGPENPTADWSYGATRRRGVLVDTRSPMRARPLDAMNYAPPFTPGALRGGSHVHVFSPDGAAVSFTYEDEVLARLDSTPDAPPHDRNQRNIGVAIPGQPVRVGTAHPRNHDGDGFSVVATHTVNEPRPGSDEISRAFEEGWVGGHRTLAFLGNVAARDGAQHAEIFLVELPADSSKAGAQPLAGTAVRRPAPPAGTQQRRLTFTDRRRHRGVVTAQPRHWLRASPDGKQIACVMRDDDGVAQLWTVTLPDGALRQLTVNATGVTSAFTWSPDGRWIAHALDGCVCVTEAATGQTVRLTATVAADEAPEPFACVFSPDGRRIAFTRRVAGAAGTFAQICTVSVPSPSSPPRP